MLNNSPAFGANSSLVECLFCKKSTTVHFGQMSRETAVRHFGKRVGEALEGDAEDVRVPPAYAQHASRSCPGCVSWAAFANTHIFLVETVGGVATGYVVPTRSEVLIDRFQVHPVLVKYRSIQALFTRVIGVAAADMELFLGYPKPVVFA